MKQHIQGILLAMALAAAGACSKAEDPGASQSSSAPAEDQAQAGDPAQAEAPIADEDLPVATDFEEEAAQQITADTYQGELEALEKEIAAEE